MHFRPVFQGLLATHCAERREIAINQSRFTCAREHSGCGLVVMVTKASGNSDGQSAKPCREQSLPSPLADARQQSGGRNKSENRKRRERTYLSFPTLQNIITGDSSVVRS
jgi:hypothetical protein